MRSSFFDLPPTIDLPSPSSRGREGERGEVLLVGAGPGHPDWITLAGYRALRGAEVVVHDRLIHPEVLSWIPVDAQRIDVGKRAYGQTTSQGSIHSHLIEAARAQRRVVRLKGGDPFLFGRGGEEVLALEKAGIAWRVIPGLSSALAAPALASIPMTHRRVARSLAIVTAQSVSESPDWATLARVDTLVVLMGVAVLASIRASLLEHGRSLHTPVALIERASFEEQRTLRTSLNRLAEEADRWGIRSPATLVVGEVAALLPETSARGSAGEEILERAS